MFTTLFSMKRVNLDELNLRFWFWDVIVLFSLKTKRSKVSGRGTRQLSIITTN